MKSKFGISKSTGEKKIWKKFVLLIIVAVLAGVSVELLYELNIQRQIKKSGNESINGIVSSEYIKEKNTSMIGDCYLMGEEAEIIIKIPEQFVNKLQYYYKSNEDYSIESQLKQQDIGIDLEIETNNEYDEPVTETFQDSSRRNLNFSVVNIKKKVTSITITAPAGTVIGDFKFLNSWDFNKYRVLYVMTFAGLLGFLFLFSREIEKRIEYGFIILSLGIGLLFIAIQPPQCLSWDEHIHMYKTFDFFDDGEVGWSEAENYVYLYQENESKAPFLSKEEKAMQIEFLNNAQEVKYTYEKNGNSSNWLGYIHMAAFIKIGQWLRLPFYILYLLGKIANLLLYTVIIFFAVKIIPVYKKTLVVMALLPTPIVLATAYSYDVTVTAFLVLGTALIVREYMDTEKKIRLSTLLVIVFCFIWGSLPKAVYIPLILSLFFMPSGKFKNKKISYIVKAVSIVICIALLLTYIIPASGSDVAGDPRGGNTSISEQLQLVIHHPLGYARVLFRNIKETLSEYTFGELNLSHMAYIGIHEWYSLITVLIFGVALTEPRKEMKTKVKRQYNIYRISLIPLILGIVILIWTALYLCFTEVGQTVIAGVQARYYIPLFLPLLLVLYTDKVRTFWKERNYNLVMFLILLFIWHQALYNMIFLNYCS